MKIEHFGSSSNDFVLTEQGLQDIFDAMKKQMDIIVNANNFKAKFNLKLQDLKYGYEAVSELSSLAEVFAVDNGDVWIINEVKIETFDDSNPELPRITVSLMKPDKKPISLMKLSSFVFIDIIAKELSSNLHLSHKSIEYTIVSSDRDWIYQTSIKLEEKIKKSRSFPYNSTGLGLGLLTATAAFIVSGNYFSSYPLYPFRPPLGYIILAVFVLLLLFALGITFIKYFDCYTFCWGEYKKQFDRKRSIGTTISIVIIVGLLISVIGSIIGTLVFIK